MKKWKVELTRKLTATVEVEAIGYGTAWDRAHELYTETNTDAARAECLERLDKLQWEVSQDSDAHEVEYVRLICSYCGNEEQKDKHDDDYCCGEARKDHRIKQKRELKDHLVRINKDLAELADVEAVEHE